MKKVSKIQKRENARTFFEKCRPHGGGSERGMTFLDMKLGSNEDVINRLHIQ